MVLQETGVLSWLLGIQTPLFTKSMKKFKLKTLSYEDNILCEFSAMMLQFFLCLVFML
jgi:hypothetical protein